MKRLMYVMAVCVTLCCGTLTAQEKPNFVGTWKLFEPATADQFTPSQIAVAQDDSVMTVTTIGQMGQFKTQYKLDGSVGPSPLDFNGTLIDRVTKLAWDGNKLVLTATSDMNGQSLEFKSVWSLTPDGALAVEVTFPDFQNGAGTINAKATYKKG